MPSEGFDLRRSIRAASQTLRAQPDLRVRRVLDEIVGPAGPIRSERLDAVNRSVFRASQLTTGVEQELGILAQQLEPPTGPFTMDMTMAMVLRRHADANRVLAGVGLPGCGGCAVRHDETLAEAVEAYGFDGAELIRQLNTLLGPPAEGVLPHNPR